MIVRITDYPKLIMLLIASLSSKGLVKSRWDRVPPGCYEAFALAQIKAHPEESGKSVLVCNRSSDLELTINKRTNSKIGNNKQTLAENLNNLSSLWPKAGLTVTKKISNTTIDVQSGCVPLTALIGNVCGILSANIDIKRLFGNIAN